MGLSGIRVIMLTNDNKYYNIMKEELNNDPSFELFISASQVLFIENKLSRYNKNLIIIDLDTVLCDEEVLAKLVVQENVFIILTGAADMQATRFIRKGIRDFVVKPVSFGNLSTENYIKAIKIKLKLSTFHTDNDTSNKYQFVKNDLSPSQKIISIAASTGGTEALEIILRELQINCPPILIVQHMPAGFTKLFAERLNTLCKIEVREAIHKDRIKKGLALIAPADSHMIVAKDNQGLLVECFKGNKVHGVMPAADVLFESMANIIRDKGVGVILTGMGADGGRGLMMMHNNGAKTIGQNKETCVVYGMPRVAYDLGAVDVELPICDICKKMLQYAY